ncbi:MAG: hypothetical protein JSV04_06365 [Candidatus Heimdallarchaeota archaeon]|nr:MAG: hypothetical protein JSV04_06365 [Candidatus Heimdallarchaeota archaeon]
MGLEDDIKNIRQEVFEIRQALQVMKDPSQMIAEVQSSLQNMFVGMNNLENSLATVQQIVDASKISSDLQSSIQNLPFVITDLEESIGSFQKTFEKTAVETKNDLKFIKVSYVEDVVGSMRKLSDEISTIVGSSSEETKGRFEASINNFVVISDKLDNVESNLNALIENQTDQLATVAELRDRVNAIIQVELTSLRDRIAIYLENSINELKTSVTERLADQDGTLQILVQTTNQLTQNISALPEVINHQINEIVETNIITELTSMKKEMKKMTAFIVKAQRQREKDT